MNGSKIMKIGDTFDQLTVIDFISKKEGKKWVKYAICKCSCGNTTTKSAVLIKMVVNNHCGCRPRVPWQGSGSVPKFIFTRYVRGAEKRDIEFATTIEYVSQLYEQQNGQCAITGLEIPFGRTASNRSDASLDRIDSNKEYIEGNLQWVHKDIQKMKMDLSQDRFIELCKLVSNKN